MIFAGQCLFALFLWLAQPALLAQDSVEDRRKAAYMAAGQLDLVGDDDPDWLSLLSVLSAAMEDEDTFVRAFAARALERVARRPHPDAFSRRVRELLGAKLRCEDSVFVRPWLERGVGPSRPDLHERIERAAAESLLHRTSFRELHPLGWRGLWSDWMDVCTHREPEWRQVRWEGSEMTLGQHEVHSARSLRFVATLLRHYSGVLILEAQKGDPLAGQVLQRIDAHLRSRLEWMTDRIEEQGQFADAMTWLALSRAFGIETFEQVVKPNFHHPSMRGSDVSLFLKAEIAPAVIDGLVHGLPRERGQAMRLLKLMGPDAELAAPFVIYSWGEEAASVESPWLGFSLNLYDAISGGGFETFALVCEAMAEESPARRAHARKAVTRFGGRTAVYARRLEESRPGFWAGSPETPVLGSRETKEDPVQERRQRAWDGVEWLLQGSTQSGPEELGTWLEARLDERDVVVRRFAAYGLGSFAASNDSAYARRLRSRLGECFDCEQDLQVRYWLGIGCRYYSEERNPELDHLYYQTRIRQLSEKYR